MKGIATQETSKHGLEVAKRAFCRNMGKATVECTHCERGKPMSEFRPGRRACKECSNARRKVQRRTDPLRELCVNAAKRAELKGLGFNVTPEYLHRVWRSQEGCCYFFKVPLHIDGSSADSLYQASLDRLDNSRGYVEGNVALTCVAANLARNAYTPEQFFAFCRDLPTHLATKPDHALRCLLRKLGDPRPIMVSGDLDVITSLRTEMRGKGQIGRILYSGGIASFVMHLPTVQADMFFQSLRDRRLLRAIAVDPQGVIHA